jgi:phytoene dehydrogenase-like protein
VRRAFAEQAALADGLWALFDDPTLRPPWSAGTLARLAVRAPRLAPLLRWVGRPLRSWLAARGLAGFEPVERFADALCQVTVQTSPDEAEAPYGLAALDFLFRGIRHVRGGIGELTAGLGRAIGESGGRVDLLRQCTGLQRVHGAWEVRTKRGPIRAPTVVANLAPHALRALVPSADLGALAARVETGWGAVMSYRQVRDDGLPTRAFHLDLVADPARPLIDGNHVLVSVSEPRPGGIRTATISTHTRLVGDARAHVERVQDAIRATVRARAPEVDAATIHELPGSPRTFARFVGRPGGWVGGVPRRAGLAAYVGLWPRPVDDGLWLVGDAVLLGQSTLATFAGGLRTAAAIR